MNDKQLAWHRLVGDMYAIIEKSWSEKNILGIFPSPEIATINFKQLYYNKKHDFTTRGYYALYKLELFEHENNWELIRDDLQTLLPQKRRRKTLNDEKLQNRLYLFLKENNCRAKLIYLKNRMIYERVDCFGVRNYYTRNGNIKYCKIHNCTGTGCNCNQLLEKFYEIIEKEGINPFYYELDTLY